MRLRYTAEYRAAVGLIIVGAFLLLAVRVMLVFFPFRQLMLAPPLWIDGFFCIYLFLLFPLLTLWQEHTFHRRGAIGPDGQPQAIPVRHQPDTSLALKPGETLRLRSLPLNQQIERGFVSFSFLLFLCILVAPTLVFDPHLLRDLSALLYQLLQRLGLLTINPEAIPSLTPLTPLEWIVVIAPFVIGFLFPLAFILLRLHPLHEMLIADDTGLRWQAPLRRTRTIAWHDVIMLTYKAGRQNYCVFSRDDVVSFAGPSIVEYVVPNSDSEAQKRALIKQEQADLQFIPPWLRSLGDLAFQARNTAYNADARRLLATITVRSRQPFAIITRTSTSTASDYTIDDIINAPLEPEPGRLLRATAAFPEENTEAPRVLRLEQAAPLGDFFKLALRWSPIFLGVGFVLGIFISPNRLLDPQSLIWLIVFILVCWLMGIFLAIIMQTQSYRNAHPTIVADDKGLMISGVNNNKFAKAKWDEIRAWAIDISSPHEPPTIFVVTTKSALLLWQEPTDAEQAATALALRRLIVEKTGLPLRQLGR